MGPNSAFPSSRAQLGLGSKIKGGYAGAEVGNWSSLWVWNWRGGGVCMCVHLCHLDK